MNPRTYFIPGVDFETLANNDAALAAFKQLLLSIQKAKWNVTKAEETTDGGIKGMVLSMIPIP